MTELEEQTEREKPKYHQMFLMPLTKFEIVVLLVVKCDTRREGINFIKNRGLNGCLTTRCKTAEEARKQLWEHIWAWSIEESNGDNGTLIYWKIYDEEPNVK